MILLREAHIKDIEILKYWDTQQHVIDAAPNEDWNWEYELPRELTWRVFLIAELNAKPIGFVQIIDPLEEETHYWGLEIGPNKRAIDIWIGEQENLGQGYGTIMMQLALEHCFSDLSVTEVFIDPLASNTQAIRFYKRLGFQFLRHQQFEEDFCHIYSIQRSHWKNIQSKKML